MEYTAQTLMIILVFALIWTGGLTSTEYILYDPGVGSVFILWFIVMFYGFMVFTKRRNSKRTHSAPKIIVPDSKIIMST